MPNAIVQSIRLPDAFLRSWSGSFVEILNFERLESVSMAVIHSIAPNVVLTKVRRRLGQFSVLLTALLRWPNSDLISL